MVLGRGPVWRGIAVGGLATLVGGCLLRDPGPDLVPEMEIHHVVYYPNLQEIEALVSVDLPITLQRVVLKFPADTLVWDDLALNLGPGQGLRVVLPVTAPPPDTVVQAIFTYSDPDNASWDTAWRGTLAWVEAHAAVVGRMVLPESTYFYVRWPVVVPSGRLEGTLRQVRGGSLRVIWTDPEGLRDYQNGASPARFWLDTVFTGTLQVAAPLPGDLDTGVVIFEYTDPDTAVVDARLVQVVGS